MKFNACNVFQLTLLASALAAPFARAADGTWTGAGGDGLWGTGTNWSGGVVDGSGASANFNAIDLTTDTTVTLTSGRTVGSLTFGDTEPATPAGWTLQQSGIFSILNLASSGTPTITVNTLGAGKVATIAGVVGGSAGFTKLGSGTLSLTAPNTYTGVTTISEGVITVNRLTDAGVAGSLGQASSDPANWVFNGGTFQIKTGATNRGLTLQDVPGNAIETTDVNWNLNLNGSIVGAGGFTKTGPGHLDLYGSNSYDGVTTVASGVLHLRTATALGSTAGGTVVNSGGTLNLGGQSIAGEQITISGVGYSTTGGLVGAFTNNSSTAASWGGPVTLASDSTIGGTGSTTISGVVGETGGSFGITVKQGTLTLTNTNTYSGATTVNGGTLKLGHPVALGPGTTTAVVLSGALDLNGQTPESRALTLNGSGISSDGALINSNTSLGSSWSGPVSLASTSLVGGAGNLTISGAIGETGGAFGLTKRGSGTLTLSTANSYSGLTRIDNGTLKLSNAGALGTTLTGTQIQSTGTLDLNGQAILGESLIFSSSQAALINSNTSTQATWTGAISIPQGSIGGAGDILITGSISGGSNVTKTGTGTLILSNANTYYSGTTVSAGTLQLDSNQAAGTITITLGDANTGSAAVALLVNNNSDPANNITVSALGSGPVTIGTSGGTAGNDTVFSASLTANRATTIRSDSPAQTVFSGNIDGNGTITITGTGTVFSGGASTFTGIVNIANGTQLQLGSTTQGGNMDYAAMTVGGTLQLCHQFSSGWKIGIGSLSGSGTVQPVSTLTGTAELWVGGANADSTFSGTLQNNGTGLLSLIKWGTGTLTLSGANTHSRYTMVRDGTLSINSIKNVNSAEPNSLGLVTSPSYGTIYIGNSSQTGTLQYTGTGDVTDRVINLTGTTGGAGLDASGSGLLKFTSALAASGAGSKTLTLSGSGLGELAGAVVNNSATNKTSILKSGLGTWTLSGANTYTGTTTISSGTLRLVGAAATILTDGDTATTSDIIINGGSLVIGASEQIANSGSIYMTSGSFGFGDASGLSETIDKLTNLGGTFSTGANTIISTGSTVTWADGTNTINAGGAVVDHHWVISGGTNTVSAGVTGGTLQVDTAGTAPTGLEFSGTGTPVVTLVAAGAGETAGRILLRNDVSVADTLTGSAQIVCTSQTNPGIVNLDGGTRTFTVNNAAPATDLLISASVQNGGLTKTGAGTLELTGTNTYTGVTTVSGGVLSVGVIENGGAAGNLGQAGSESANLMLAGGTLQYTGATASTDRGMTFNNVAGNTLDVSIGGTVLTVSGALTGAGGLTKVGSGTLTLTGSNDYANGTTVSAGKLVVTNAATTSGTGGTGSGSVTVAAGATLAGTGRIAGATSLSNAVGETRATHAVGDGTSGSTGVQYFGSGLTYGSGSIFEWDLRANSTAGSFDQVNVNGALSVDSSTIFRIVLGGAVDLTDSFWSTPYITQTWNDIFTSSSLIGGFDTSNIQVAGLEITGKGSFSVSGTSLTWTAVPELSNLLAGALLGAGLLRRRRKGCCG